MKSIEMLNDLLPIMYPEFYTVKNHDGNEYVLVVNNPALDVDQEIDINICVNGLFASKTQYESLENHYHLFNKVKKKDVDKVFKISMKIARNLKQCLNTKFPNKSFMIYLDLNYRDSVILRFHQKWNDEPIYYDKKECATYYETGRLLEI